ncbi:hypothetical protein N0V94_004804 [Neodidymelliopsis sp. IMI 364377]|nr:hypothetical protein N0V94_004804 [Neodidymelliopsis sp. IMI 364377]
MCSRLVQLLIFTNVATASFLPVLSKVQSALQEHIKSVEASAPTFTQEPTIYDPADINFGPTPEDATPGEVKVCTGVDDTGTCDVVHTNLGECRNLSAVFKKNVLSVWELGGTGGEFSVFE